MYNTGVSGFLTAACSPNREIDTQAIFSSTDNEIVLGTNDLVSYKISQSSVAGKSFTPGSFVTSRLELSLNSESPLVSEVDFKNALFDHIDISAGIRVVRDMVYVPMGTFYLTKDGVTTGDDGLVSIEALDIPPVLSEEFNSATVLQLPCTVAEALNSISEATGLGIVFSSQDFPNLQIELDETFSLVTTYREALMYIAEVLGAYAKMGRNGEVLLRKLFSGMVDLGFVLDDSYLFSVKKQESSVKPFQYIGIKANQNDLGVTEEVPNVNTNCRYDIIDNPLTYGHPEDFLQGLIEPTSFSAFYPSTVSFQGRPDLDTGDVLEYMYKGNAYLLPICNNVFEYNGGFKTTLESIGSDTLNSSSIDGGIKTQISALRQSLNILVRDLSQTQSQIVDINGNLVQMSSVLQTVEKLNTEISRIDGDLEKITTLQQTAEQLTINIKTIADGLIETNNTLNENQKTLLSYFDFQADGLTIGVNTSNVKLKLANNRIQFLRDENEVAYFSGGQLYVTDAQFIRSLVLGNFEFTPRSNGNLSLRRRR